MKKIQIVPFSKMEEMRKIFYEYLIELSKFDPDVKFDKKGVPIYDWYDCYWEDKDRYPFYLIIDGKIAGLALIRELDNMIYEIAEFYVRPKFRKDGNAIWFATQLTELFDGQFSFSTRLTNPRAIKFWDKFVKSFDSNKYIDDEVCRNWTIRENSFKNHTLNLAPVYFDLINSGEKVLEGRLNDEKRKNFNIGDRITFYKEPEKTEAMNAIILNKYVFDNFEIMAKELNKKDLGFQEQTKKEMINTYRTIYSKEDEQRFGVVVFKIKVIK